MHLKFCKRILRHSHRMLWFMASLIDIHCVNVKTRMLSFWISLLRGKELKLSHILYNFLHTGLPVPPGICIILCLSSNSFKKIKGCTVEETRSCAFFNCFPYVVTSMCILILKNPHWQHFNTQLQVLRGIYCHSFARCRSNASDKKNQTRLCDIYSFHIISSVL